MTGKRWCEALTGIYERRDDPAARCIIDDALEATELFVDTEQSAGTQEEVVWFARLSPGDLHILEMNDPGLKYIGLPASELNGKPLSMFTSGSNAEIVHEAAAQAIAAGRTVEVFISDRDGRTMILHMRPTMRGGSLEILAYAHDARYRLYQRDFQLIGEA